VRFGKYYLPIISIESNNSSEFLSKLEELSLVKDFVSFKKKIHDDKILEKGLREIKKILKKDYVFRILTYYPKSKKKISFNQNSIQDLLNDIHYFYQIIYDSRHNFFKLRHIHYLLPKLIKSFKDCKKVFSQPLGQEVSCELRTEESM
jgi:cell fate (sporulation/competence/biofilm development) regulator YmcA (YheA/YmcA/DUF963 family)